MRPREGEPIFATPKQPAARVYQCREGPIARRQISRLAAIANKRAGEIR